MRDIDWDQPLTEDDKLWLGQRLTPELKDKIAANEARFSEVEDDDDDDFDDEYDSWKVAELRTEAESREGLDLTGVKTKPELIAALRTWDAAHPDE